MRFYTALLPVAALLLSACGQPTPDAEPDHAPEVVALERPDPTNPAGYPEGEVPPDWQWRFDRGNDYTVGATDSSDTWFVTMTPGWHVTTSPAGIFYHPANTAEGTFTATTKIHLFDPGTRNEGYGMIVGGRNLEGPEQSYLYFLVRRSGEFLVKLRTGADTEELIGWTANENVAQWTDDSDGTITNVLGIVAGESTLSFLVNEVEVASLERGDLNTDGIVGLRLNHSINVHVTELTVTPAS